MTASRTPSPPPIRTRSAPVRTAAGSPTASPGGVPVDGWQAVAAMLFAVAWSGNEFTPLLTFYRQHSGLSAVAVNSLLAAYVLGIAPALLIGGPLSDRYGRRRLMLPAPGLAAAGSLLLAVGDRSFVVLLVGRVLCGIALGLGMAVGTSWLKELSDTAGDDPGRGARRASLSLTAGFGLGAAVAAALAQFAPWPSRTAYLVCIALCLAATVRGRSATDVVVPAAGTGDAAPLRPRLPGKRFWLVVAPAAPWVFGTAAVAYAILPALVADQVRGLTVLVAGVACLLGLGSGFAIQSVAARWHRDGTVRLLSIGLSGAAAAMALAAYAADRRALPIVLVASALLGCGYGVVLLGGLTEVQRIANPADLAGWTAVFYSLTYLGFFAPMVLSVLSPRASYPAMLGVGSVVALLSLGLVRLGHRLAPAAAVSRETTP